MIARLAILLLTCLSCQAQPWWVRPISATVEGWQVEIAITNAAGASFLVASLNAVALKIDWGDGAVTNFTGAALTSHSHTYASASTNILTVSGGVSRLTFGSTAVIKFRLKRVLNDVQNITGLNALDSAFTSCSALRSFPSNMLSTATAVTTLSGTWNGVTICKDFPEVSALTNVTTLLNTWQNTSATNYPSVAALTNVTTFDGAWSFCLTMTNIPPISSSTNLINVAGAFENNIRLICASVKFWDTNLFPNIDTNNNPTIDHCYRGCSNLTDWTSIPDIFRF
jgi:hypothetical protein